MSERFFVEHPVAGSRAELSGPEAHHALHVMRLRPGDRVTLFDGSGGEFTARVLAARRASVELEVEQRHAIDRELGCELVLGVALPKGDRQKWLIEKVTELGVTRLYPLVTERGVAQPVESALARLKRTVVEASKQCGRNRLLELMPAASLAEFLAAAPDAGLRLVAHPSAPTLESVLRTVAAAGGTRPAYWAAVGPEGGFTPQEVARAAEAGWKEVSLGARILRVETAALFLAGRLAALEAEA